MEQRNNGAEGHAAEHAPEPNGIVSVNSRSASNNFVGKIVFGIAVFAIVLIGSLIGFNKHRASQKVAYAEEQQKAKLENKPAATGPRRSFETESPPLPPGAQPKAGVADGSSACADGSPSTVLLGQDGKPLMSPNGTPMRVCKDGRVIVPALAGAQPIPVTGNPQGSQQQQAAPSRYSGDVILTSPNNSFGANRGQSTLNPNDPMTALAMQTLTNLGQNRQAQASPVSSSNSSDSGSSGGGANPPGSIGSYLKPSSTPMVTASKLGDRNMILPKGRTIDCALSMRLVNEVAGMASCVLSQNVYSDNGRVVLLERGSEATGEYAAAMTQGQRRLFVLWTRIKSPDGVIINVNSPAADSLGTSGLDGYIDNHWWDRIGAAFMLSLVQDAISYATAASTGGGGGQGLAVFQSTSESGNRMAEKVLESTINIKPTLYRNQGARGTIYVARDLDFGSVYALRAR